MVRGSLVLAGLVAVTMVAACSSSRLDPAEEAYRACGQIDDPTEQRRCRADVSRAIKEKEAAYRECVASTAAEQERDRAVAGAFGVEEDDYPRDTSSRSRCDALKP